MWGSGLAGFSDISDQGGKARVSGFGFGFKAQVEGKL